MKQNPNFKLKRVTYLSINEYKNKKYFIYYSLNELKKSIFVAAVVKVMFKYRCVVFPMIVYSVYFGIKILCKKILSQNKWSYND